MRTVHNTHGANIIVAVPGGVDLNLQPGDNSLTVEQYRALKALPLIVNYFDVGLLRDVKSAEPAPSPEEESPPPPPAEKPLDKMNKAELLAKAQELLVAVSPDDTNANIRAAIESFLAAQSSQ